MLESSSGSNRANKLEADSIHWKNLIDHRKKKDFENKVKKVLDAIKDKQQSYQMRRILLGISTQGFEKLDAISGKRTYVNQLR